MILSNSLNAVKDSGQTEALFKGRGLVRTEKPAGHTHPGEDPPRSAPADNVNGKEVLGNGWGLRRTEKIPDRKGLLATHAAA